MGSRFSPINLHLVASEVASIVHDCVADMVFYTREFALNVANAGECTDSADVRLHGDTLFVSAARPGRDTNPSDSLDVSISRGRHNSPRVPVCCLTLVGQSPNLLVQRKMCCWTSFRCAWASRQLVVP